MEKVFKRPGAHTTTATRVFVLLLVVCLAECVTEQRINSRGSKSSNIVEKANGWRSQRGGMSGNAEDDEKIMPELWSFLLGAHGKRSGKPPATAPDWYLSRILRRMAANAEMNRDIHLPTRSDDISAALQMDLGDEAPSTDRLIRVVDNEPVDLSYDRNPEAKPMLDDDILTKIKYWQMMRQAPEEK